MVTLLNLLLLIALLCHLSYSLVINSTNTNLEDIICPSNIQEKCTIVCSKESCNNINIYCLNNDYGCNIICRTDACQYSIFYIKNAFTTNILCENNNSCKESEFYIEPKNNNSTIFIDFQSSSSSLKHVYIKYDDNDQFINNQILYYKNISTALIAINPITIICRNSHSCDNNHFIISSLNYFKLYCLSDYSCLNINIDFISYNDTNRGNLSVYCNGYQSCYYANINAITANRYEMFCDEYSINSCGSVLVYCPINQDISLMNNNCIMHCSGNDSCVMSNIYAINGLDQLNLIDIDSSAQMMLNCGYNFDLNCIIGDNCNVCNDISLKLNHNDNNSIILGFKYKEMIIIEHDTIGTCIIYVQSQSVICKCDVCIIVCLSCDRYNIMIDATNANILILKTTLESIYQSCDIYGPNNGIFISNAELINTSLYLSESQQVFIDCNELNNCYDIRLFVNLTDEIHINCQHEQACTYITTYITNLNTNNQDLSIPYCRLQWNCTGCVNATNHLQINSNESKQQCNIYKQQNDNHIEWKCNQHKLMPTYKEYNYSECNSNATAIETTVTINDYISTVIKINLDSNHDEDILHDIWSQYSGLIILGILVMCGVLCVILLCLKKRSIEKNIAKNDMNNRKPSAVAMSKHLDGIGIDHVIHEKEDTIGTSVEDMIQHSLSLKNPLQILVPDDTRTLEQKELEEQEDTETAINELRNQLRGGDSINTLFGNPDISGRGSVPIDDHDIQFALSPMNQKNIHTPPGITPIHTPQRSRVSGLHLPPILHDQSKQKSSSSNVSFLLGQTRGSDNSGHISRNTYTGTLSSRNLHRNTLSSPQPSSSGNQPIHVSQWIHNEEKEPKSSSDDTDGMYNNIAINKLEGNRTTTI